MTTLEIKTTEQQPKPVMEIERAKFVRAIFDFFDGKAWCYRKIKVLDESDGKVFKYNYYCYNCKNELFFRTLDSYKRDLPPFRFHKLLVKKLDKKADDWKTGRKNHIYYAFCCKCAKKNEGLIEDKGTVKESRWTKKCLGFEIEKCDCQDYLFKVIKELNDRIKSYNSKIAGCDYLKEEIDKLKYSPVDGVKMIGDETFEGRILNDFINQLEKIRDDVTSSKNEEEDMLKHVLNQEIKYK